MAYIGLGQVGNGAGGFGFYIAADNGGDEAAQGGGEISGREVVAGEEVGQVSAEFFCGTGASFFLAARTDHLAGARWEEKASACSARNDSSRVLRRCS